VRLTPRSNEFYPLFTQSATHLLEGVRLLAELLVATGDERKVLGKAMRDTEHDADETTHMIMKAVNATFITPFDREDIYRLASALDDVMDEMEEAVDLVVLYDLREFPVEFGDVVGVLSQAADLTASAMARLRTMNDLSEYWIEINRLENMADRSHRKLLARLFSGEFDALTVLKIKDVAEALEAAADAFEKVANTVESIAVKES
jgi:predicted phosphate transport protein (TIGR00153 family)